MQICAIARSAGSRGGEAGRAVGDGPKIGPTLPWFCARRGGTPHLVTLTCHQRPLANLLEPACAAAHDHLLHDGQQPRRRQGRQQRPGTRNATEALTRGLEHAKLTTSHKEKHDRNIAAQRAAEQRQGNVWVAPRGPSRRHTGRVPRRQRRRLKQTQQRTTTSHNTLAGAQRTSPPARVQRPLALDAFDVLSKTFATTLPKTR